MPIASAQRGKPAKSNKRRGTRTHVPSVELRLDGARHVCSDWGLGGCRISGYSGPLRPGDKTVVELYLRLGREHKGLRVDAHVLRYEPDPDDGLALRFEGLNADVFTAFCRAVEEELRERGTRGD